MAASFLLAKLNHMTDIGALNHQYQIDIGDFFNYQYQFDIGGFCFIGPNTIDIH